MKKASNHFLRGKLKDWLKDWMVIFVDNGVVFKYEDEERISLVEITSNNEIHALNLYGQHSRGFRQSDAWLIARVISAMLKDCGVDAWDGSSRLLPISFNRFDTPSLRALAALAYCWRTELFLPWKDGDFEEEEEEMDVAEGYVHHISFDDDCWNIVVTEDLKLEFIYQRGQIES